MKIQRIIVIIVIVIVLLLLARVITVSGAADPAPTSTPTWPPGYTPPPTPPPGVWGYRYHFPLVINGKIDNPVLPPAYLITATPTPHP